MSDTAKKKTGSPRYGFLVKNVFWLSLARIVATGLSLVTLPIITARLEPGAFGIIALFTVEAALLAGIYNMGLFSFVSRMIYKYDRRNDKRCRQYIGVSLFYLTLFSLIGFCLSIPFAGFLKRMILKDVVFPSPFLLYVPLVYAFFRSIYGFNINVFLSLQQNKNVFVLSIIELLSLAFAKVIGLVWFGFTWVEIVILELLIVIVVSLVSLWLVRGKLGFSFKRLSIIGPALRFSLPYIPMNFSSWIQNQIDKVFLGRMYGMSHVGVYAIGARLGGVFSYVSKPITSTLKPEISKKLDSRDKNTGSDITDFFNLFFQCMLFLIFTMSLVSREIVTFLVNDKYFAAFKIIPFVAFGIMFSELGGIFRSKFLHKNKTAFFPIVVIAGALLNVALNCFLIPRFGMLGAAGATVLANLLIMFMCYFISQKLHFTRYDLIKNFSTLVAVALFILVLQVSWPLTTPFFLLKLLIIALYGVVLWRYLVRTNVRFRGLLDNLKVRSWS